MNKPAIRVLTGILAVLFSIAFIFSSFAAAVSYSLSHAITPEKLAFLIKEMAKLHIIENSGVDENADPSASAITMDTVPSGGTTDSVTIGGASIGTDMLRNIFGDYVDEIDQEFVNAVLESKAGHEVMDVISLEVAHIILDTEHQGTLHIDHIKESVIEHMDELLDVIDEHSTAEFDHAQASADIIKAIESHEEDVDKVVESVTSIVDDINPHLLGIARFALRQINAVILIIVSFVLVALIFVCRLKDFGGLVWIGIDTLISSIMLFGLYFTLPILDRLIISKTDISQVGGEALTNVINLFDSVLCPFAIGMAVFACASLITGIVLKVMSRKKKA